MRCSGNSRRCWPRKASSINADVPDMDTLQNALNRAVERRNMALFTPVGQTRELAAHALRLAVEAITDDDTTLAAAVLEQVEPESPDNSAPTVSACIGAALGLLDDWLSGHHPQAPAGLGQRTRLPAGHWTGERAATDILVLARKRRAFRSLDTADQQTRRPQRPIRQRPRTRRRRADLVTRNRHPSARARPHGHPLKPVRSQPTVPQCCEDGWNPPEHSGAIQSATAIDQRRVSHPICS